MQTTLEKKHSVLGIASFLLSIAVGILIFVLFVAAGILHHHRVPGSATYPGQTLIGLAAIGLMFADVLALALGVASVCQTNKNRLFGILGLVFSLATIIGTIGLMILGLVVAHNLRH